jgi:hypothetical protein
MSSDEFAEFEMGDTDGPIQWPIRMVKFDDVVPMPDNPRTISDRALSGLEASLSRFGYVEPIVWNERTGHIVGGHQRFSILKGNGVTEAMMVVANISAEEEMAANLTLNNPKIEGTWSDSALSLVSQVEEADDQLFRALNMDELKESLRKGPVKDDMDSSQTGIEVEGDDVVRGGGEDNKDTECPCCKYRWNVRAEDVSLI